MTKHIAADDQRKIRLELEEVRRTLQTIFSKLKPLDRSDMRVTRTEAALAAIERVLWTVTPETGSLNPSELIEAILSLPATL